MGLLEGLNIIPELRSGLKARNSGQLVRHQSWGDHQEAEPTEGCWKEQPAGQGGGDNWRQGLERQVKGKVVNAELSTRRGCSPGGCGVLCLGVRGWWDVVTAAVLECWKFGGHIICYSNWDTLKSCLLRKIIQNLEIKQKNDCMSFQHYTGHYLSCPSRPAHGLTPQKDISILEPRHQEVYFVDSCTVENISPSFFAQFFLGYQPALQRPQQTYFSIASAVSLPSQWSVIN